MIDLTKLELLDRDDLLQVITRMTSGGVALNFHGKRSAVEIAKRVRPRVTRRVSEFHVGTPEEQCKNLLIEGENLQAMVTLYKYRGQVDLIVTDPPYNTGGQFRYNDRWDTDPNDPDLGQIVTLEDGSRHTKWMKAMLPRLHMMKAMLKPQGVIAICIDDNELFHLGMMMDEIFGEDNRLGVINWQKTYSPKNDSRHVSSSTEYVLVYCKDRDLARTGLLPRTDSMDSRYVNPDNDPRGKWIPGQDATAKEFRKKSCYAVQSPFTGEIYYPTANRHWNFEKAKLKQYLEEWGTPYVERDIGDRRGEALMVKNIPAPSEPGYRSNHPVLVRARRAAEDILHKHVWPVIYFGMDGQGAPRTKRYLNEVRAGIVPMTFWADEAYEEPLQLDSASWPYRESGHSKDGLKELDSIIGVGHEFQTVKPLKLIKKIIQIWCPPNGLVLDAYAGSGTTGHAVLELNNETGSSRRFILIEQGRPENGDKYARTLTWRRLRCAITGERPDGRGKFTVHAEPLGGGFEFRMLTSQIDAKTVLSMKRDELVDVVITSHWDSTRRSSPSLIRIEDPKFKYLVGKNEQSEGYFIIWDGDGPVGRLDINTYRQVLQEGKKAGLKTPYHVYARYEIYQSRNVAFYKIPDKILAHLGLNESSDRYNEDEESGV